jgi:type III secretion protein S
VTENDALQFTLQSLWLVLLLSAPPVLVAALVGLVIAIVQAATQIQEQTFQYAAKLFAIVLTLFVTAALLGGSLYQFGERIFDSIPAAAGR